MVNMILADLEKHFDNRVMLRVENGILYANTPAHKTVGPGTLDWWTLGELPHDPTPAFWESVDDIIAENMPPVPKAKVTHAQSPVE